jgi:hypothetical protein
LPSSACSGEPGSAVRASVLSIRNRAPFRLSASPTSCSLAPSSQDVEEGRLAAAARADDRGELVLRHLEVETADGHDLGGGLRVDVDLQVPHDDPGGGRRVHVSPRRPVHNRSFEVPDELGELLLDLVGERAGGNGGAVHRAGDLLLGEHELHVALELGVHLLADARIEHQVLVRVLQHLGHRAPHVLRVDDRRLFRVLADELTAPEVRLDEPRDR